MEQSGAEWRRKEQKIEMKQNKIKYQSVGQVVGVSIAP